MMESEKKDVVILDGGLGILLFTRGAFQRGDPLWSSRCLTSGPEGRGQLKQAHLDFLAAGADIIKTNSYQLSVGHLQKCLPHLNQEDCLDLIRDSVRIAREACQEYWQSSSTIEKSGRKEPKVAGSIGPYGACLADLSEYTGAYVDSMSMEELIEWHRPRLLALLEAGVDYLALETFPALLEARAILKLLHDNAPNVPSWISFSCKEEGKLCHGEDFAVVAEEIWKEKTSGLRAIGVNCSEEKNVSALLTSLVGRNIPVVIYPNSVDFKKNEDSRHLGRLAEDWMAIYPHIWAIGGCCGYQPEDIAGLRSSINQSST